MTSGHLAALSPKSPGKKGVAHKSKAWLGMMGDSQGSLRRVKAFKTFSSWPGAYWGSP